MQNCFRAFLGAFFCLFHLWKLSGAPFVEGKLTGQLGNQMFVIAATVSLALDHGAEPLFPDLCHDRSNNIPFNFANIFYHLPSQDPPRAICSVYKEPFFHYQKLPYSPDMQLCGYFQSEKYFANHREEILELFAPHQEIVEHLQSRYPYLLNHPYTVSVHLRSYHDHDPMQEVYIQHGREFLARAMSLFCGEPLFVVFSNNMSFCKKEMDGLPFNIVFVEGDSYHHEFYLMSRCKHHIISNSTFAWWAAYLNPNPDKMVIAPLEWFTGRSGLDDRDLIPDDWCRI